MSRASTIRGCSPRSAGRSRRPAASGRTEPIGDRNRIERRSELRAGPEAVWSAATDPAGINYEMRPLVRMTMPRALRGASVGDLTLGVPAGRCWLLLFGLLPVDYDDLCIVELEPPRRFLERSRMASMSLWEHERVIEPLAGGGSSVTDRLRFQLRSPLARVPGADRLAAAIVAGFFAHRHRRLRRRDRAAPSTA